MTYKEIAKVTGEPLRSVQFDFPAKDAWLLRQLPGMEDYDNNLAIFDLIKAMWGLKDAPSNLRHETESDPQRLWLRAGHYGPTSVAQVQAQGTGSLLRIGPGITTTQHADHTHRRHKRVSNRSRM